MSKATKRFYRQIEDQQMLRDAAFALYTRWAANPPTDPAEQQLFDTLNEVLRDAINCAELTYELLITPDLHIHLDL